MSLVVCAWTYECACRCCNSEGEASGAGEGLRECSRLEGSDRRPVLDAGRDRLGWADWRPPAPAAVLVAVFEGEVSGLCECECEWALA